MHVITWTKNQLAAHLATAQTLTHYYQTPAGIIQTQSTELGMYDAMFVIPETSVNITHELPCQLILAGTPFQNMVWQALLKIKAGSTVSYKDIACIVNHPTAYRAVANAVGDNNIAYFVPCHRVIRANNDICGYNWGAERKQLLLHSEGIVLKSRSKALQ